MPEGWVSGNLETPGLARDLSQWCSQDRYDSAALSRRAAAHSRAVSNWRLLGEKLSDHPGQFLAEAGRITNVNLADQATPIHHD